MAKFPRLNVQKLEAKIRNEPDTRHKIGMGIHIFTYFFYFCKFFRKIALRKTKDDENWHIHIFPTFSTLKKYVNMWHFLPPMHHWVNGTIRHSGFNSSSFATAKLRTYDTPEDPSKWIFTKIIRFLQINSLFMVFFRAEFKSGQIFLVCIWPWSRICM